MDIQRLVEALQQEIPALLAIYVFGSRIGEQARDDSDLDLAFLGDVVPDAHTLWALASGRLADLAGCDVDLVDLRTASTVLQYQIITTGRRVWEKDSRADLYESFILSEMTALQERRAGLISDIRQEGRVYGR